MAETEAPSTGWEPDVPATDTTARRYVTDWAELNYELAAPMDAAYRDDLVVIGDCSSMNGFLNTAMLMHPRAALDPTLAVTRAQQFFAEREGGEFIVVSPWPTADLRRYGFTLMGYPPLMLRPAGGDAPSLPDGLEIRRVESLDQLRVFEDIETRAYGENKFEYPDTILHIPRWSMWLGSVDGDAVATAAASLAYGITRVEWIATLPEARGRGVGEAMTWLPTLVDPERDAVLIASDVGRPIYERMGFRALGRFTLWTAPRKMP